MEENNTEMNKKIGSSTIQMKRTDTCPLCNSEFTAGFYDYEKFSLIVCNNCGLVFQNCSNKADVNQLISEVYDLNWVNMRHKYLRNTFIEHATFNTMLLEIFCQRKGKLLEIGAGTGEFLFLAQEAGWDAIGLEPSLKACQYAKDKYELHLINNLWNANLFEQSELFDVIVFWHVLEHIANPVSFLKELWSRLNSDGLIMFSVPNRNSLTNSLYKHFSPIFTEPDHLFHYSADNLSMLMDKSSFKVISLFSREELNRLNTDIAVSNQRVGSLKSTSFEESMSLMVRLQSDFQGHELFCIARKKGGSNE
ncbi:class I SAM-dependent methyltransferase [Petroclostridium sp. X23]|uniref:class I SAM-dependent methyltransferase n=1 Tax=Petroclostridium sp. X23 TaxID=3045146 RepID=UPI0024AE82A0|nr:class I SAM-dependent methyltransferase [Petroclostridium sp. X23]WHH58250.1 class I SAM-dependent methyltransferase [Petroclostridium sp. X23]